MPALHPVELYEITANLLVFLLVWRARKKFSTDGFVFMTYLAGYGAARFAVEFFRGNPAIFAWSIPAAQVFASAAILISVAGFYILGKPRSSDSVRVRRRSSR